MTLQQLLDTLASTTYQVTLLDSNEKELIKFYSGGQENLDSTLLKRTIQVIKIDNQTSLTVELAAATA